MNEVVLSNTYMPVVAECGLLTAAEPFYHMDRVTDFNVMIYVTDGVIYVTEDETDYEINAGEVLFLKSGLHHYGKHEIERGTRWYYVHFYTERAAESENKYIQELTLPKKLTVLEKSRAERILESYTVDFYSDDTAKLWKMNSRLFDILTELAFIGRQEDKQQTLSDKICAYLTKHCCEPFSAKDLEHEFYLSYKHMAAVFKKERGISMQQYHTKIRMNTACRLLKSTLMPIAEIAASVGYTDALYFSRCFRAAVGTSPMRYRKNMNMY